MSVHTDSCMAMIIFLPCHTASRRLDESTWPVMPVEGIGLRILTSQPSASHMAMSGSPKVLRGLETCGVCSKASPRQYRWAQPNCRLYWAMCIYCVPFSLSAGAIMDAAWGWGTFNLILMAALRPSMGISTQSPPACKAPICSVSRCTRKQPCQSHAALPETSSCISRTIWREHWHIQAFCTGPRLPY